MIHIHISDNPLYYISFARRIQAVQMGRKALYQKHYVAVFNTDGIIQPPDSAGAF